MSDHGIGEATTSIYVLVFNCSIAAGALVGGFGIDAGGPTVPVLIGALFSAVSIVALSLIRETSASRRQA